MMINSKTNSKCRVCGEIGNTYQRVKTIVSSLQRIHIKESQTLQKFHRCMKCLDTSLAAFPYTTAPMSCHGIRGVLSLSMKSGKITNTCLTKTERQYHIANNRRCVLQKWMSPFSTAWMNLQMGGSNTKCLSLFHGKGTKKTQKF